MIPPVSPPKTDVPDRDFLVHLSIPAILCTCLVSFVFAAEIAGSLTILTVFGPHAYFVQGLRLINWKKGTLSTGGALNPLEMFLTGVFTVAIMIVSLYGTNFVSGRLRMFLRKRGAALTVVARLTGAAGLFLVWYWICLRKNVPFMHPSSLAPLIGAIVLILKAGHSLRS
jgi:hypothetical protein